MRVLVACEFSGVVREAFAAKGHDAWSCDLLPTEIPGQHIHGDAIATCYRGPWDLIVAHPPCTHLSGSGARWWPNKEAEQRAAIQFFMDLYNAPALAVCVENPVGIMSTVFRKPDQYIQPWQFGHGETKKTGLWLRGLSKLTPTKVVVGREPRVHWASPGPDRWKERSRTLTGIAQAMADQWGARE
jgi:site-specific DNA-cytosine methylase